MAVVTALDSAGAGRGGSIFVVVPFSRGVVESQAAGHDFSVFIFDFGPCGRGGKGLRVPC